MCPFYYTVTMTGQGGPCRARHSMQRVVHGYGKLTVAF